MTAAPSRRVAGAASRAVSTAGSGACAHALIETTIAPKRKNAIRFIRDLQLACAQFSHVDGGSLTPPYRHFRSYFLIMVSSELLNPWSSDRQSPMNGYNRNQLQHSHKRWPAQFEYPAILDKTADWASERINCWRVRTLPWRESSRESEAARL